MKKRKGPTLSRKEQRKKERLDKKARKHEYFSSKKKSNKLVGNEKKGNVKRLNNNNQANKSHKLNKSSVNISLQDEQLREVNKLHRETRKLDKEMKKKRLSQLKHDATIDDMEIKKLEKLMGLNKRKEKTKINSFAADGLDYLLDVCDQTKLKETMEAENQFQDDDNDDFGEDLALVTGKKISKSKKKKKEIKEVDDNADSGSEPEEMLSTKVGSQFKDTRKRVVESLSNSEDSGDSEDEFTDDDDQFGLNQDDDNDTEASDTDEENLNGSKKRKIDKTIDFKRTTKKQGNETMENVEEDNFSSSDEGSENDEVENDGKEEKDDGTWEDIYGRTRDKEGNVVEKYQPPHMRKVMEGGANQEKLNRLKKQMKGLLNRLAENNMVSIAAQIEQLYGNNSRNDMNETLWTLLKESLISDTSSPERLVAEHAMLLAVLSANVGGEVSAHCLQKFVTFWHELWTTGSKQVQDKRTNNILLLLSYMYHFKLFHCTLLYDILEQLIANVGEKEVELILLVLRTVGLHLRKEDPVRLKDFVVKAQTMANKNENASDGTRIKFLLETILAIKNNNMSKIPNYNPELGENLKKSLRACIRTGNYNAELKVTLEDLLKADVKGRWWVVGSAWTGELPGEKDGADKEKRKTAKKGQEGFSTKLIELAKKQRMNTDTRRTVFCIIMSAEDYLDAFEKLFKLGLKGPSEREIMNVILHCLLQEKQFNPYYEHLARRFCQADRRFQVMLQFATWDKIQILKSLEPTQVSNLAKFLGRLILEKNLAISVLKVIEFGELDKAGVRFVRQVLLSILLADSEEAVIAAFGRIAGSKPLKLFREGLRLFLHHFVLRNSKDVVGMDMALLTTRVKFADSALSASDRNAAF